MRLKRLKKLKKLKKLKNLKKLKKGLIKILNIFNIFTLSSLRFALCSLLFTLCSSLYPLFSSMSHAPQLPEQPCNGDASSEQLAVPSISLVSCTAHLIPNFCISLFVEISESILCPLIINVSDNPITKKPTATIEIPTTTNQLGIFFSFLFL